ncbi:MAG: hypothetical protein Q9205_007240, partial [Flavoplaca limonia]
MISSASTLLALLPLALSTPINPRNNNAPLRFGAIAARSASPIHLQTINANGQSFWIGKETATYCPLDPQSQCPPGNQTVFSAGNGGASLDVVVPGGQSIYVAPNGKLSYTIAHSASIPAGSARETFTASIPASNDGDGSVPLGSFTFEGLGGSGFLACPSHKVDSEQGPFPYQVFAGVPGLKDEDVPSG